MEYNYAIVVGGSGGIGKSIISKLISKGIYVINIDKKSIGVSLDNYTELIVDLTIDKINPLIQDIFEKYKHIEYFICSIGYYAIDTLDGCDYNKYRHTMLTNIDIPTIFAVELAKIMRNQSFGKMIFISSAAAYIGSRDIPYSISKSAILGLMRGLCKNLHGTQVYCYAIAPGIVETEMSRRMPLERQNDAVERTINKRACTPDEVAKAVCFLLMDDDGYMNGSVLHINNGLYSN